MSDLQKIMTEFHATDHSLLNVWWAQKDSSIYIVIIGHKKDSSIFIVITCSRVFLRWSEVSPIPFLKV